MGQRHIDLIVRMAMVLVGFAAFTVGVVAFDWRVGAIVSGALLLLAGLYIPYDDQE